MQDDLLHAQASVDWAVSKFPAFQAIIDDWLRVNINFGIKKLPADMPYNHVVAFKKETLPLSFGESGATRTLIPAQGGQQSGDCGQQVIAT